jgi:GT2 family glycosyltransferase
MVVNNFLKKLAYLYKTSVDIIQEYGFLYFLRFGSGQVKQQKLDILKPKENYEKFIIKKPLDKKIQYKIWKEQQEKQSHSSELNSGKLGVENLLSVVVIVKENTKTLVKCIESVLEQSLTNFELLIITDNHNAFETIKELINTKSTSDRSINLKFLNENENFLISELLELTSSNLITILDETVFLKKNCFNKIINESIENHKSDLFYSDEEILQKNEEMPFFKPDWSPYLSLFRNYMGNLFFLKRSLLAKIDLNQSMNGENFLWFLYQSYENAENIYHIRSILYSSQESTSRYLELKKIIPKVLKKRDLVSSIEYNLKNDYYKINFELSKEPKVSIIIPTKDNGYLLRKCLRSIEYNTNYDNYEIIIIDNNSVKSETKQFLKSLPYTVIPYNKNFNFSKMNNLAVSNSSGEYLLFLNDDTEALEPNWLNEMISVCQQKDVGAVGAKLIYRTNKIQHAGMAFLKNGFFFHPFDNESTKSNIQFNFINLMRECSSVTGACLLTKREIFEKISGFDEQFDVFYGDSDLCFKIRELGFKIIYNPYALLLHDGSHKIRQVVRLFVPVENHGSFTNKWKYVKYGDQFYNPNLGWNYSINIEEIIKN